MTIFVVFRLSTYVDSALWHIKKAEMKHESAMEYDNQRLSGF